MDAGIGDGNESRFVIGEDVNVPYVESEWLFKGRLDTYEHGAGYAMEFGVIDLGSGA